MREVRSRLSSKGQTVIPKEVRRRLELKPGDTVRFRFGDEGAVTLERLTTDEDDPFAAFHEWASPGDDEGYKDL